MNDPKGEGRGELKETLHSAICLFVTVAESSAVMEHRGMGRVLWQPNAF